MPEILTSIIGLVGILFIIFNLNMAIFWASISLFILMIVIYLVSGRWNFRFNQGYNDELENRVNALTTQNMDVIKSHFQSLIRWNIKLSDLETTNYALIWLGIIALLAYTPIVVIESGIDNYGLVFSTLMYVFQYIENLVALPLFIQQLIRFQEISRRLGGVTTTE